MVMCTLCQAIRIAGLMRLWTQYPRFLIQIWLPLVCSFCWQWSIYESSVTFCVVLFCAVLFCNLYFPVVPSMREFHKITHDLLAKERNLLALSV
jgi:hypothetical protein